MANDEITPIVCGYDNKVHLATNGKWCPKCGIDNTYTHAILSGEIVELEGPKNTKKGMDD